MIDYVPKILGVRQKAVSPLRMSVNCDVAPTKLLPLCTEYYDVPKNFYSDYGVGSLAAV